jgi:putative heme transporter
VAGKSGLANRAQTAHARRVNLRLSRLLADKRLRYWGLLVALWVPIIALLVAVRSVLLPFLLAVALAYVVTPPVRWMSTRSIGGKHIPRWACVVILYVGTALLMVSVARIFVPQIYKEVERLAADTSALSNELSDERIGQRSAQLAAWAQRNNLPIHIVTAEDTEAAPATPHVGGGGHLIDVHPARLFRELVHDVRKWVKDQSGQLVAQAGTGVKWLLGFLFSGLLVMMMTAFLVGDSERIFRFVMSITPGNDQAKLSDLIARVDRGLSGVVRGQLTICLINGVLTLVGLLLLQVKFAFLLATTACVLSLIPIFGTILSTVPIFLVALSSGVNTAVLALLWIAFIHLVEANLLNPKIMGDAAKIHPVLVILALVVGEHFYGFVGALLAVPMMSIVVTIYQAVRSRAMQLDRELDQEDMRPPPVRTVPRHRVRDAGDS